MDKGGVIVMGDYKDEMAVENKNLEENILKLKDYINNADAIVIGAGIGLSFSSGFVYSGERFEQYFGDFSDKYGFNDMYSGGFYPYKTMEEKWAFWSRYIYVNRYMKPSKDVYDMIYDLVDGRSKGDVASQPKKDYFILTTNVDHQFRKAGFAKRRIFHSQGDFGMWQCSGPCHKRTYDNKEKVVKMLLAQGFSIGDDGKLLAPENEDGKTNFSKLFMEVPSELVPYCPVCGEPMSMNMRADNTFVEDEDYSEAAENYEEFLDSYKDKKVLFLELGVGSKTPAIIKYPFWNMTQENENAMYACINYGEAYCPKDISERSVCIDADIDNVLKLLQR